MGLRDRIKRALPIVGLGGNRPNPTPPVQPAAAAAPAPAAPARPAPVDDPRGGLTADAFVAQLVKDNPIVLFMKGSPGMPQCGFSANASGILRSYGRPFAHFDVLSDPDVRQAVKDFGQWPTIPQIYIGGEFIGGSDILAQMHANGELKAAIEALPSAS
ncbi:MAG: Grx4 family monothiol glutaredoxin [Pseudomonadota bacterium]|jgi:monothiol glutaredoxin